MVQNSALKIDTANGVWGQRRVICITFVGHFIEVWVSVGREG